MLKETITKWLGEERRKFVTQSVVYSGSEANSWRRGYTQALEDLKSRIPELEEMILVVIKEMREDCRNDGGIQYLSTYDEIINTLKGVK